MQAEKNFLYYKKKKKKKNGAEICWKKPVALKEGHDNNIIFAPTWSKSNCLGFVFPFTLRLSQGLNNILQRTPKLTKSGTKDIVNIT